MRKILGIAWASLLRMGRDRMALLLFLVMPMILIGILGVSLGGLMSAGRINPFTVIVVNEDQPAAAPLPAGAPESARVQLDAGKILLEEFFGSERLQQIVTVSRSTGLEDARTAVRNGKAAAAIHMPPTFSADILAGK